MDVELRSISRADLKYFLTTCEAAFGWDVKDEEVERVGKILKPERTIAAYDGETMVGTAADYEFTLTVPGAKLTAAGVTMVGVLPSHRRKGVLTKMMLKQLEDVHARGEPLAVLWASEGNIYQRFGYGIATMCSKIDLDRDRAQFRLPTGATGRMRMLEPDKAAGVLAGVYDRVCDVTPGMYERSREWWEAHRLADPEDQRDGGGPLFRAVWELDGRAEAYALYRMHEEWDTMPTGHINVFEAIGTSPLAVREIWRFLIGIDLVARIRGNAQPAVHPLLLMLAEPRRLRARLCDALLVRIVDVKTALETRTYAVEGAITFEVSDPQLAHNDGRWKLEVGRTGVAVERTTDDPDLILTIADLGCVYLGGFTFRQLLSSGSVFETRPRAAWEADSLFRTEVEPWCPEIF
jgi:predicted acetyltransferase